MKLSKRLMHRYVLAALVLLISFVSLVTVTFAWYIYQISARTADIHMAVGTGNMLQISDSYDGEYGYVALLDKFEGFLTPVSTNRITGGFQKVTGFVKGGEGRPPLLAAIFDKSEPNDYYKTTLFLRQNGERKNIYLADISYEDSDLANPISTAIRMGFVIHEPGREGKIISEYIFAINMASNPRAQYNTETGEEGYVLDCTKSDGTTVPLTSLYTPENFCKYDRSTGEVTLLDESLPLFSLAGGEDGAFGEPVQVDVYIWLEGCDQDCTNNLCSTMLKNIALSFVAKAVYTEV